ncbi:MAG: hypothetical protein CSA33_02505 [Desulfobulbus propionicus]|nr:MAG: hypothetical protein CSA33_02505 [Desulfobulbus propionicus]
MNDMQKDDYGIVIFKEGTSPSKKRRGLIFFTIMSLIVLGQSFYWVFANRVEPIILGMPFSLFTVAMFIVLEFIVLLVMYSMELKEDNLTGGKE